MIPANVMTWEAAVQQLRSQPGQRELVRACFYDDPLIEAAKRYHASTEWKALRLLTKVAPARVLDLGAGRGIAAYAFACDGWQTTALEPDPSGVVGAGAIRMLAEQAGLAIKVVQTWGEALPFADGSFEVVHCRQVLHHARDLSQLIREVARVLAPGGLLVATREHVISKRADLNAFLESHPLHRLYGGEHAYTLAEYTSAIEGSGLEMVQQLNPLESEINTYPQTLRDIKRRWARKMSWPLPGLIPNVMLAWAGGLSHAPGRLYTFVGRKPLGA